MTFKKLFALVLAVCMAFSTVMLKSSAETNEEATPDVWIWKNPAVVYADQTGIWYEFSNLTSDMEYGIFYDDGNGNPRKWGGMVLYKSGKTGLAEEKVVISKAGDYHMAIWKSGYDFQVIKKFTVSPAVTISGNGSVSVGTNATFSIAGVKSDMEFGILPGNEDGTIKTYSVSNYAVINSDTSQTISISTPGCYVAAVWGSSWSFAAQYPFKVTDSDSDKSASMDKASYTTDETVTVATKNWVSDEGYFIRIYKKPVSAYNSGFLADTYGAGVKDVYKFYPYNWEPGEYQLIAFEKTGWKIVNKIDFTVTEPAKKALEIADGVLTANENVTLDLSEISPDTPDGKLFIGWKTADGNNAEKNISLSAGDILTAQFIDFDAGGNADFKITETSVRTEKQVGLRFTVQLSDRLYGNLPGAAEYGAAVLPSDIVNGNSWAELELNKAYAYGNESFTAADIPAEKLFDTENGITNYTVCITDITDSKLIRQYTVRGYIKYTDLNGNGRVLYTDYASANMYAAARTALENDGLSDSERGVLNCIVDKVKAMQSAKYENTEKIAVTGSAEDPNYYVYKIGENGISVREAVINLGLDNPIEIVQLSDMHLNYLNSRDYAEKNPTVLSTNDMRTFGKNASSVGNARNAIDFARTADAVVLTGDTFDYLTYGGIELLNKEIWDIIPDAIVTVGNHEYLQKMQGVMPETLSAETRWQILRDNWKHNIDYSSKVVGNKVMLIQLNNGEGKFYDSQKAKLEADIELAKTNSYKILMFMHEPICTGNSADTNIPAIRKDDGSASGNYYSGQVGNPGTDSATKAICDIIAANGDIIKGVFNGHQHADYYSEILAKTASGENAVIPQYTLSGCIYGNGSALKITVK